MRNYADFEQFKISDKMNAKRRGEICKIQMFNPY